MQLLHDPNVGHGERSKAGASDPRPSFARGRDAARPRSCAAGVVATVMTRDGGTDSAVPGRATSRMSVALRLPMALKSRHRDADVPRRREARRHRYSARRTPSAAAAIRTRPTSSRPAARRSSSTAVRPSCSRSSSSGIDTAQHRLRRDQPHARRSLRRPAVPAARVHLRAPADASVPRSSDRPASRPRVDADARALSRRAARRRCLSSSSSSSSSRSSATTVADVEHPSGARAASGRGRVARAPLHRRWQAHALQRRLAVGRPLHRARARRRSLPLRVHRLRQRRWDATSSGRRCSRCCRASRADGSC